MLIEGKMNDSGDNTSEAGRRREEADYTNAQKGAQQRMFY